MRALLVCAAATASCIGLAALAFALLLLGSSL